MSILRDVRDLCSKFEVMFKLNSVINKFNLDEDMTQQVCEINPIRSELRMWRVFDSGSEIKLSQSKALSDKCHVCLMDLEVCLSNNHL